MKIFPPEPEVVLYEEGFEDKDILQRAKVGKSLSDLVERIEDPMVVALDGGWGTGKTYFLKRWVGAHTLDEEYRATTVYFDAFTNDYVSDPLPALVSALIERFPQANKNAVKKIKGAVFKFAKPMARVALAMATYGATEALAPVGDAAVNALNAEASNALENYWSQEDGRHAAMKEFHSALTELVAVKEGTNENGPVGARLVIVVDELDRCRPDYALEVLEVIKHFFAIPGITYVLGANLVALENSVKARYGPDIDASAYLRKFINVSLSLPSELGRHRNLKDTAVVYLEHHLAEMGVPAHIGQCLTPHVQLVARNNNVSIRDIGKILSSISLLSDEVLTDHSLLKGWIDVLVALLVSRVVRPEIYLKFLNATVSEADLESYFDATLIRRSKKIDDEQNSDCDRYTWFQYNSWIYLARDGNLPAEDSEYEKIFDSRFDGWGRPDYPRSIPKSVHREWLDLFRMTSS